MARGWEWLPTVSETHLQLSLTAWDPGQTWLSRSTVSWSWLENIARWALRRLGPQIWSPYVMCTNFQARARPMAVYLVSSSPVPTPTELPKSHLIPKTLDNLVSFCPILHKHPSLQCCRLLSLRTEYITLIYLPLLFVPLCQRVLLHLF